MMMNSLTLPHQRPGSVSGEARERITSKERLTHTCCTNFVVLVWRYSQFPTLWQMIQVDSVYAYALCMVLTVEAYFHPMHTMQGPETDKDFTRKGGPQGNMNATRDSPCIHVCIISAPNCIDLHLLKNFPRWHTRCHKCIYHQIAQICTCILTNFWRWHHRTWVNRERQDPSPSAHVHRHLLQSFRGCCLWMSIKHRRDVSCGHCCRDA